MAIGTSCLALVWVIGRRRVPAPPERMRPFMAGPPYVGGPTPVAEPGTREDGNPVDAPPPPPPSSSRSDHRDAARAGTPLADAVALAADHRPGRDVLLPAVRWAGRTPSSAHAAATCTRGPPCPTTTPSPNRRPTTPSCPTRGWSPPTTRSTRAPSPVVRRRLRRRLRPVRQRVQRRALPAPPPGAAVTSPVRAHDLFLRVPPVGVGDRHVPARPAAVARPLGRHVRCRGLDVRHLEHRHGCSSRWSPRWRCSCPPRSRRCTAP